MHVCLCLCVLVGLLWVAALPLFAANALNRIGYGARSTGLGGAFTGLADDTASINTNPAGLAQIDGRALDVGFALSQPRLRHEDAVGGTSSAVNAVFVAPWVGYAHRLAHLPLTLGVAAFVQGGEGVAYRNVPTVFGTTDDLAIDLQYLRFAPAAAYALSERLSLGSAIWIGRSTLDLQLFPQTSFLNPMPTPGSLDRFFGLHFEDSAAYGVGGRIGILYRATDWLQLGLQYATPSVLAYRGGNLILNMHAAGLGQVQYDGALDNFSWPQELGLGMVVRPLSRLQLSTDLKWINWDGALNTVILRAKNPRAPGAPPRLDLPVPLHWKDQWVIAAGLEYRVTRDVVLRAGYNHANNPIPKDTLSPLFATIVKDHLTAGFGFTRGRFGIDASYIVGLPIRVSYTRADGLFRQAFERAMLHAIEMTLRYRFGGSEPAAGTDAVGIH
ncbi:MAG: OmpP1/FadL family transporter [Candidatus Entotheonellia bacterium]